jgi:hypothetical protein
MAGKILYSWKGRQRLDDWKLEGKGEIMKDADGSLHVRTYNNGPLKRATNIWLKDLELPENYEVAWTYRNGNETGHLLNHEGVMILFNALPVGLSNLWEDNRPEARYSAMWGQGKMVLYSCGYNRAPYGGASQLRKLGGHTPAAWCESSPDVDGRSFEELTIISKVMEPLTKEDEGRDIEYRLEKRGAMIKFWCNDALVHDLTDEDLYRFWPEALNGGHMAFRTFAGYIDNYYSDITVSKL